VIIGGGGHGLATAYYLARNHAMTNIAVIEKGWLGGGNTGATRRSSAPTTTSIPTPISTSSRSSCGKAVAGAQLQRDVQRARCAEPRAFAADMDAAMRRGNAMR
jgi:uncharacterized protein with NAD-binding domain and iron-sulfur cluster